MLKKIQIALYDRDGYMNSLADYLCRKGHNMLETRLFTKLDMLKKSVEEGKIDVLLAGEEVANEIRCLKDKVTRIMLLSEGSQVSEESEFFLLFKYQSAQNLVKEVLAQIAEDDMIYFTQKIITKKTVELIGVFAPFGGAGVTDYALSMAKELAKQYKTLYINMELFQGLDFLLQGKKKEKENIYRGMSEVVFYLKQRKEKLALKLETVVIPLEELDVILAVEDYRDLYSLGCGEMRQLLKVLLHQTDYEKVVFDIGYTGDSALYLMEQCSRLYMPEAVTPMQKSKEQAFWRFLRRENYEQMVQNFKRYAINNQ